MEANGFKIEKGVKPRLTRNDRATRWPFGEMKPNDSFLVGHDRTTVENCRSAASYWGVRHGGQKFSVQKTDEGYRCWRIA